MDGSPARWLAAAALVAAFAVAPAVLRAAPQAPILPRTPVVAPTAPATAMKGEVKADAKAADAKAADAKAAAATVVAYKGKVVDESNKPVSGIFPMTFKLYAGLSAKRPIWEEILWVAVDRGIYNVRLGERKPLPAREDFAKLVIGVEIRGLGEVVREPFVAAKAAPTPAGAAAPTPAVPAGPGKAQGPQAAGAKYADSAAYAVESDHAKNADRLQNLSLEDLIRKLGEEISARGGAGGGGGKATVGAARRLGARIGGTGGTSEYNEACPKGYVMVGVKGGAGLYLDSIQIVCAPIE
jgi:hypothetical protein